MEALGRLVVMGGVRGRGRSEICRLNLLALDILFTVPKHSYLLTESENRVPHLLIPLWRRFSNYEEDEIR